MPLPSTRPSMGTMSTSTSTHYAREHKTLSICSSLPSVAGLKPRALMGWGRVPTGAVPSLSTFTAKNWKWFLHNANLCAKSGTEGMTRNDWRHEDMKRLLIASTNARQDLTFEETMIATSGTRRNPAISVSASDCAGVAWRATTMEHDCHVQQMHRKASNLQVSNRNGANTWDDKRTREQIPDPCQRKEKQQRGDKQRATYLYNCEDKWMRTKIILPGPGPVW